MGYEDFVQIKLDNRSGRELKLEQVYVHWGKLYEYPEKDKELSRDTVENHVISAPGTFSLAACGRKNSPSGTEGEFGIYDGDEQVMKIYWSCPYSGNNKFATYYVKDGWHPSVSAWNTSGALGTITVTLIKL